MGGLGSARPDCAADPERSSCQYLQLRDDAPARYGDPPGAVRSLGASDGVDRRRFQVLLRRCEYPDASGSDTPLQVLLLFARQRNAEPPGADAEVGDRGDQW